MRFGQLLDGVGEEAGVEHGGLRGEVGDDLVPDGIGFGELLVGRVPLAAMQRRNGIGSGANQITAPGDGDFTGSESDRRVSAGCPQ